MKLLRLLLITAVAIAAVYVLPTPWALHIGQQFTPTEFWSGFGPVQASNGGRYVLFVQFHGGLAWSGSSRGSCSGRGCDTMFGTAKLCTESGNVHAFTLRGNVHGWWTTDNARTSIDLTRGTPEQLPQGWVVALHGVWNGPTLSLESPDNSFTEVFTPAGAIRHVTSTADAGTARVVLRFGSEADFDETCRTLRPRSAARVK
jgi:hypothetical protein